MKMKLNSNNQWMLFLESVQHSADQECTDYERDFMKGSLQNNITPE
ncbi:hypothetical protein APTSU1_001562300 [Apodemus speciosus]|uniref:Uncharacterized protein n=1 Tax=Apodemus speciosus TaxID=105296 RepID=A0ABQ0FMJ2_APOSI